MTESFPIPFGGYQLIERLAVGGMAELFLARSLSPAGPSSPVVIKRLLPHMADDPHFNAMFIDEAKLTSRLAHPNIVETLEFNRHGEQLFMVMEYVDGLDGLALLRECARRKVRLPTEVAVHMIHEVLDALDFAHTQVDDSGEPLGVVHRDISPSNVLVSRRGEVKLVDFGIAHAAQRHHNTKDGTLKGKYGYMSPEQVVDADIDARSDLFSVGVVLSELLTGRRLFAAPNELDVLLMVRDVRLDRLDKYGGHIGMDLARILRKSLAKSPDDRFASAAEFRDTLADWMYLHNHEVTPIMMAQIVDSLYDEAWRRKREAMVQAGAVRAAMMANLSRPVRVRRKEGRPDDSAGNSVVQFVAMEPSEVLSQADHIDGIPAGQQYTTDSLPVVSIEDEEVSVSVITEPAETDGGVVTQAVQGGNESLTIDMNDLISADDDDVGHAGQGLSGDGVPEAIDDLAGSPVRELAGMSTPGALPHFDPHESSALDFDDSTVSVVKNARRRSGPMVRPDFAITREAVEDRPDDQGEFSNSPPVAVLFRLAVARATGLLVTAVGGICKEIYFREGIPEYVTSNVAKELFGEYLKQQGVLSTGELSMALAMMPHYSNKLGDTLVGLGLLKPLDVFRHLTRQVRHKLVDVCTWSQGMFRWYGGRENPCEAFPLDLDAFEVVGAGAMALPGQVVEPWLAGIALRSRPRLVGSARVTPEVFQLGPLLQDVCARLDGERYIAELKSHYKETQEYDRFVRALYLLVHTGLVTLDEAA